MARRRTDLRRDVDAAFGQAFTGWVQLLHRHGRGGRRELARRDPISEAREVLAEGYFGGTHTADLRDPSGRVIAATGNTARVRECDVGRLRLTTVAPGVVVVLRPG
jgi:hypothetical protein